jgi:hypothetical protein
LTKEESGRRDSISLSTFIIIISNLRYPLERVLKITALAIAALRGGAAQYRQERF